VTRPRRLDDAVVESWVATHPRWQFEGGHLVLDAKVPYDVGCAVATASVPLAAESDHHPIITIGYDSLRVELWTHDRGGVTQLDIEFAEFVESFLNERRR
jgi:4a-hydroxytetrahydrobiopterin dehydratase